MKIIFVFIITIFCSVECLAQQEIFEKRFRLVQVSRYGTLWGKENKRWLFETKSASALDDLYSKVLPKSIVDNNKIILSRNELDYFLKMDDIEIETGSASFASPPNWGNHFGKQIQTITFSKPLNIVIIRKDKLVKSTIKSLVGIEYRTFYPHGERDVPDNGIVPIVYKQENEFDANTPVLMVTSDFIKSISLEKARVIREKKDFGTKDLPGVLHKTAIDIDGDGQQDIVMYCEEVFDSVAEEGDESAAYRGSMIGMYFKNKWHRTSYWEEGSDGLEGF